MAVAHRDSNRIPVLIGVSTSDLITPIEAAVNPTTNHLQVDAALAAATSGGATPYKLISAASTNSANVKASAGQLYGWAAYNTNGAARYLKLYNKATAPTVGTDVPVLTVLIPGNANGAGSNLALDLGVVFSLGIGLGITTGVADNDTGAVGANEVIINLFYF